jgi:hypothetical protein
MTTGADTTAPQRLPDAFSEHHPGPVDGAVASDFTEHWDVINQPAIRNRLGLPLRLG